MNTKKRVLLVDDEDDLTAVCGLLLERTGQFEVRCEHDGLRALETAREFRPDIVFLDRDLPDKDGAEIAQELHADGRLAATRVVFLTGSVTCEEAAEANAVGHADEIIAKPMSGAYFVRRALEIAEEERLVA